MDEEEEWLMDRKDGGSLSRFEGGLSQEGRRKKEEGREKWWVCWVVSERWLNFEFTICVGEFSCDRRKEWDYVMKENEKFCCTRGKAPL